MSEHYYSVRPTSEHKPGELPFCYRGVSLRFATDSGVFSRREIDRGTQILLDALPSVYGETLDMGCGYGALGVSIARVNSECRITMCDINERACALARRNAELNGVTAKVLCGDGYAALPPEARYACIVQNPPIRAGKAVIYRMFADAARFLEPGAALWLVIRKQQGAPSAVSYLRTLYARVDIPERESGYWILRASGPIAADGERTKERDGAQASGGLL